MLVELQVRDFAIIDRLTVSFGRGLNVLTGETGAGKSIIIDALSAALGARIGPDVIRAGQSVSRVEAAFDLTALEPVARARFAQLIEELGVTVEEDLLLLSREVHASGRSLARVGGRLVPVSALQRLGEMLVDIHGQSDHLSLFRPADQLDLLDRYAGVGELREEVACLASRLRQVQRERAALVADERELARRLDLLRYQVEEIQAANLKPGEEAALEAEHRVLAAAEKLTTLAAAASAALEEAQEALGRALAPLRQASTIDEGARPLFEQVGAAAETVDDLRRGVRRYQERVESNPERLAHVEERLALLATLRRKYGATVEEVIAFGEQAAAELAAIERRGERQDELVAEEEQVRVQLGQRAGELSVRRQEAAERLAREVEAELRDLGLGRARFAVALRQSPDPAGVQTTPGRQPLAFDETGVDRVEFQLAANPGEPLRPLARVASGGEAARIMLTLKAVLGRVDTVPTLIFDEIDVGIGGRTGRVVGEKLWCLAETHQVLCITHLPQVASFADRHLSIVKLSFLDRTSVEVRELDTAGRQLELAQMLGGVTPAAKATAADLLARAEERKAARIGGQR
ncbi:MAG: DNA repair protein RecN [Chloroflexi bacterium]|nr:DNA repair protein RecN [Chloroflexota bacterium]